MNRPDEHLYWPPVQEPTAEELAQAEASLHELEPAPALTSAQIDAMVAAALASGRRAVPSPPRLPRWRPGRRLTAAAAALLLSLSLAWVGAEMLWPEGQRSVFTLDFPSAVQMLADPSQSDARQVSAILRIDEHCGYAIKVILRIERDESEPTLSTQARQIRGDLATLLAAGNERRPRPVDQRLLASAATAEDPTAAIDRRREALQHLGDLTRSGTMAILAARLDSDAAEQKRQYVVDRLRRYVR